MPFFTPASPNNINIDYSKAVTVIANYNPEGKIIPVYVSLENDCGDIVKIKIDGVKYTKDDLGRISYCCLYTVGSRQRELMLTFYIDKHVWVLNR